MTHYSEKKILRLSIFTPLIRHFLQPAIVKWFGQVLGLDEFVRANDLNALFLANGGHNASLISHIINGAGNN